MAFSEAKQILDQAFDEIWDNKVVALKTSLIPLLALLGILAVIQAPVIKDAYMHTGPSGVYIPLQAWMIFADLAAIILAVCFVAVKWHRFILFPDGAALPFGPTLIYCLRGGGYTLGILIVCLIICFPFLMMTGGGYIGLSDFRSGWEQGIAQFLMTIFFTWLFYWFYLAISPSLVDAAIGAKEGVFGALKRTKGHGKICRSLSVIITGCTGVTSFIGIGTLGLPLPMVLAINLVVYWLAFMISISILTVIYRINNETQAKIVEAAEDASPAG